MSSSDFEQAFGESEPPRRKRDRARGDRQPPSVGKIAAWLLIAFVGLVLILMISTGQGGVAEVQDTEAAVIVNYLTGEREVYTEPGYRVFIPFIQQAFIFDKSPQQFLMEGDRDRDANHVRKLTVRANDGSNFWFDELQIQYRLIPENADFVLADSGAGDAFKHNWVRAYARSILRDEFGRYSAVEVANPAEYTSATDKATERLNGLLVPHGVEIIQIITPRPTFEPRYEKAIEERKVADQEVQKLMTQAVQLVRERERRLSQLEALRSAAFVQLNGELDALRIAADEQRVKIEKAADAYYEERLGEAKASRAAAVAEAEGLVEKARNEAEGLRAITAALESGGEILVREELASLLRGIRFTLVPYSRDPSPTRIELLEDGSPTVTGGGR